MQLDVGDAEFDQAFPSSLIRWLCFLLLQLPLQGPHLERVVIAPLRLRDCIHHHWLRLLGGGWPSLGFLFVDRWRRHLLVLFLDLRQHLRLGSIVPLWKGEGAIVSSSEGFGCC